LKDGELEMDSCLFYMSEKDSWGFLPKPKSEIAALVLKARLHQIGSEHMDSLIEMMMPLVNAEATIQIQTYASTGRGLPWRIQWVQQHTPLGERNFVALESLTQSTDITESFFEAVSCAQEDFRLIQWTKPQFLMAEARSSWAKSQLIWHCENEKFRAEVYMGLQAVDNDQLHSQVMLRQLEQL
jgi:hypothetical protein